MKKWWLLAVCGLLAACSQSGIEELNASINGDAPMFYASVEDANAESRTYLDETGKMRWTNDDRITIFFGDNYNREFAFTGKTGALSGGFKQISVDDEFMAGTKMTANYALYPHSSETMLDPSGYFECELPAVQNYAEESFGLNANTMVSVTQSVDDRFLQFKNVGGYLKLNLYGANVTVKQITLQGNNNEPLAGAAIITPTYGGEPTLTWAASGTTKTLTLDCGSGVKIGQTEEDATAFYLVVPPTTFEKGFTVTITDAEGKVCTKSTSNKQTFTRNVTKNMPAFEAKCKAPNPVPSNQIWYTSTDGNIVEPDTNAFGVAIKSNTYTDGKGVITFEGDVTTIGDYAFYRRTSLASINISEGVTELGKGVFAGCSNLQHFEGKYASDNGRCLIKENVLIAFAPVGLTTYTVPEGVTTIGRYTFFNCTSLASITLPNSVTSIGSYAFSDCTSLASITIPEELTTIAYAAFENCTSLASITIPEGVTKIESYAFYGCTSLASITIPESVTELEAGAFANCSNLQHFEGKYASDNGRCLIKENVLIAFAPAGLTTYTVPEGVTTIGANAFEYCTDLKSIIIPEGVTTIGRGAFYNCTSLASITLPEGVTTIGDRAFYGCTSLKSVYCKPTTPPSGGNNMFANNAEDRKIYVPAGSANAYKAAEYWSDYAADIVEEAEPTPAANEIWYTATAEVTPSGSFGATMMSNEWDEATGRGVITFNGNVTSIAEHGFSDESALTSITLPETITRIGNYAFEDCSNLTGIKIPDNVTAIGIRAFKDCVRMEEFRGKFASADGNCLIVDGVLNSFAPVGITEYLIPDGVTEIGVWAFNSYSNLTKITIPDGVTKIGEGAFAYCTGLKTVHIPNSVTEIGGYTFYSSTKLAGIYLNKTTPPSVGEDMLSYNMQDVKIYIPFEHLKSYLAASNWSDYANKIVAYDFEKGEVVDRYNTITYTATEKVTPYDPDAFGAKIVSNEWDSTTGKGVILFNGVVTTIGEYAFFDCSSLKSITLPEGVTAIRKNAFYYCTSLESIAIPEGVMAIEDYVFMRCSRLASVTIPEGVTTIGSKAFSECTSLTSITLPEGVQTIGDGGFHYCTSLASITIPEGVQTIGDGAFSGCTSLASITIPASVTTFGTCIFENSTSLQRFDGPYASSDGRCLVKNNTLLAFAQGGLTSYTIPEGIKTIGEAVFLSCDNLVNITLSEGVTTIGERAFCNCDSVESVTLPESLKTIGKQAFDSCDNLVNITIPKGVTKIGDYAFSWCRSLVCIYCKPTTPPTGYSDMFYYNASGRKIYVPASDDDSVINAYKAATGWSYYASSIEEYQF